MNAKSLVREKRLRRLEKTQEMWQQMIKDNMKKRNLTPDRNKWSSRCRLLVNPDEDQALKKPK